MSPMASPPHRRVQVHAALADDHRLAIVDQLAVSDLAPVELRRLLGIESNLLAHHLDVLQRTGLIERLASAGDRRRKYLRLVPEVLGLVCAPAACLTAAQVLFVCTANSARSQLAAALWRARSPVPAASAGTEPAEHVHPEAVAAGRRTGLDLSDASPRALDDVGPLPELVVTVCDRAHEQLGRRGLPAQVLHWSVPDPAAVGSPAAFDDTVQRLAARVATLAPLVSPPAPGRKPA